MLILVYPKDEDGSATVEVDPGTASLIIWVRVRSSKVIDWKDPIYEVVNSLSDDGGSGDEKGHAKEAEEGGISTNEEEG